MITPINGHIQIQPLEHQSFISSTKGSYEEIGEVLSVSSPLACPFEVGDYVYFDSWLASKYPDGKDGYYWLVKFEDIRAYEKISK